MASPQASICKLSKKPKFTIIPHKQLFIDLTQEDTTTPSPKFQVSSPSAPDTPSKTPSTKDTSSSSIEYTPKSPTLLSLPSTNGYLNYPLLPPHRVPPPPPTQAPNSMEITLSLLPITPLDVHHNSLSLSPPSLGIPSLRIYSKCMVILDDDLDHMIDIMVNEVMIDGNFTCSQCVTRVVLLFRFVLVFVEAAKHQDIHDVTPCVSALAGCDTLQDITVSLSLDTNCQPCIIPRTMVLREDCTFVGFPLDDLNDLIIKYKIPRDLHPRLPLEDFVMSELLDDAIGHFLRGVVSVFEDRADSDLVWGFLDFIIGRVGSFSLIDGLFQMLWFGDIDAAIDDLRPSAGSFNMANVHRLNAHVTKLKDMTDVMGIYDFISLSEWTDAEVQEEPHLDVRSTLQWLPFYCTPPAAVDAVIPNPTLEDLVVGTPSSKILAKAEASQKQKASTSGATSSHVAKRTRSDLAQSSGSTTLLSLFVGDDDESDDACFEISLVTPLRFAVVISSLGNQGGSSAAPIAEGSNPKILKVRALWLMMLLYRPLPTFGVLTKEVFKDLAIYKTIFDQFPTPGEMVRVESLFNDQLTAKMSVLHCMMMSHGGDLLARYRGLNQSHHKYMLSTDSRLNGYEEKDLVWKFLASDKFSRVQGELLSLAASDGFERGLSMHRTKDEFAAMLRWLISCLVYREFRVSPPTKESTVTPASKSLELSTNVNFTTSAVASEHNEEMVNAEVDGLAVCVSKGMKDLHGFIDSPRLVAQIEGNHTPVTEQENKYKKEIMDAIAPFHRFRITHLPKILNSKERVLTGLATIKLEFFNHEVSVGIKTRPSVEGTSNNKKGKATTNVLSAKPSYNWEVSGSN
nr:hypothetical protein [Tanacetum cinerariifolium]